MKKALIFLAILFVASISHAQSKEELKVKFGKISEKEIAMAAYEKDPDAPAVILFDKGSLYIGNYNAFERHLRIKIFKKEAYDKANFELFYSQLNGQSISSLKATCYNIENGQLVETKVTKDNIHDELLSKRQNVQKVTIPGVREGSIIELKYTINSPYLQDWYFQHDIPAIWSEYEMNLPAYYVISQIGQGFTPYTVNEQETKANITTSHWIQKDIPAIKPEKLMTSVEDYRTKMTFYIDAVNYRFGGGLSVTKSWAEEAKELMEDEDFGDFFYKKNAMKDELATFIKDNMTPMEKVQSIYDFIGKNFETSKYASLYMTETIKNLKSKKKITPSEMNLFFLNMLNSLGIEVAPVLIRTRDRGSVSTDKAVLSRYNRVISRVKIDQDTFFVDASGYPQPIKLLPFNSLSGYGIALLGKDRYEAVVPQSKLNTRRFPQANLTLNTEGVLSGDINLTFYGYDALDTRQDLKENGEDKYTKTILKELIADGQLESSKFENRETQSDAPLKGIFKIKTSAFVTKSDDKIYISPFLCFGEKENPFKPEERKFEVNYASPRDQFYQLTLTLPEGYKIEEIPKTTRIQMPDGTMKFEYLISAKDNTISINSKFNIKRTTYLPEEYVNLKQLYAQMLAKMGEQIVLTKISK